jgi:hypothetical protein
MVIFLRRRKLGLSSVKGMSGYLSKCLSASYITHQTGTTVPHSTYMMIRWGCTGNTGFTGVTLNKSSAIHQVNDKKGFRYHVQQHMPEIIPRTFFPDVESEEQPVYPAIVRPSKHSQGKNLWVVNSTTELIPFLWDLGNDMYVSELIDKAAEYRVYVVQGKVVSVAEKTPGNPTQVAWNVNQGGRFDVVRFGNWPLNVCSVALKAMSLTDLDFGGVDVMVDREGRAYLIEINSAPSLPFLSDGSISYRQKCMAKAFLYIYNNGKDKLPHTDGPSWKDYIHPAIYQ